MPDDVESPTKSIWQEDLLDREQDAHFIQTFLVNRLEERAKEGKSRSYVLNLDAAWGAGKTFFLRRLRDQLAADGHLVAFVDAWKDDHTDEPLTAVMAAMEDAVRPFLDDSKPDLQKTFAIARRNFGNILLAGLKGGAKAFARRAIGDGADDIAELMRAEGRAHGDAFPEMILGAGEGASAAAIDTLFDNAGAVALSDFHNTKASIEKFRTSLRDVVAALATAKHKPPFFVLVDELDRCRPLYAIELLERIKHIFDIDNVVFIVATDTQQLRHSIRAVYGADFDSHRYLHRFFDRVYRFAPPARMAFIDHLLEQSPLDADKCALLGADIRDAVQYIYSCFGDELNLRDILQVHDVLRTVVTTWEFEAKIQIPLILPLLISSKCGLDTLLEHEWVSDMRALMKGARHPTPFIFTPKRGDSQKTELEELLKAYVAEAKQPLENAGNGAQPKTLTQKVIENEMIDELRARKIHRPSASRTLSLTTHYPKWIEMAGRLAVQ